MSVLNLNVAIAQVDLVWKDKHSNYYKIEKWLEQIKNDYVDLLVLPEMFTTGFVTDPQEVAETMSGETIDWIIKQAKYYNCAITGSLIIEEGGQYYNRLLFVNRYGELSYYDKRHLFTYGGEHKRFTAGQQKLIVELNGWKICPMICYDLRFPVWSKNTYDSGSYDYDILIYMANWPSSRARAFRQLLIARAIENQSYVIGVNRVGVDGKKLYYQGDSTVIDSKGSHLLEIDSDQEVLKTVKLSYQNLSDYRQSFPLGYDWDKFTMI